MKPNIKKLLILNAPYLLFVYLFDKVGQAVRLSPGADLSGKLLSIGSGFSAAFSNALPSFAPMDLLIGIVGAVVIRLAVYVKGKNAKKYRKGMEYGSARCTALPYSAYKAHPLAAACADFFCHPLCFTVQAYFECAVDACDCR